MPSPDINAPSPSTSSVSVEDLSLPNISFDNVSKTDKYSINSSMENSNNISDVYVPTTVVTNIKSYATPNSFNTVQGMFYFLLWTKPIIFFLIANYYSELYDPASVSFPAVENQDQQALNSQFPYDAPSPPPDETFAYSEFPNQTNLSYSNEVL